MTEPQSTPEAPPSPYAPPSIDVSQATPVVVSPQRTWREYSSRAVRRFVAGILIPVVGFFIAGAFQSTLVAMVGFWIGSAFFLLAFWNASSAAFKLAGANEPTGSKVTAVVLHFGGAVMSLLGALAAFGMSFGFARGRQLRRFGRVLLPPVEDGEAWATLPLHLDADPELRAALADR